MLLKCKWNTMRQDEYVRIKKGIRIINDYYTNIFYKNLTFRNFSIFIVINSEGSFGSIKISFALNCIVRIKMDIERGRNNFLRQENNTIRSVVRNFSCLLASSLNGVYVSAISVLNLQSRWVSKSQYVRSTLMTPSTFILTTELSCRDSKITICALIHILTGHARPCFVTIYHCETAMTHITCTHTYTRVRHHAGIILLIRHQRMTLLLPRGEFHSNYSYASKSPRFVYII